ncbi:nucleotidyltransferase domain-containing protein [Rhizobium leguminosarum]|uniref:nucleotidyltransferase domain-containing protein n=1 Tax=Rhizobium leguminosarum TaxID=384 RepID=UPI001442246B|nr:nucleotidyltransferase domain-containing protein [Rhizobium leguminosarum]NKL77622.1 nucleotidyltransferase domain-containing protein [Rhizobium leguminosarum bv. viciae]
MSSVDFLLSERQQKMLAALILSPERQFGTNELIGLGGPGVGAGRNVIKAFEKSGVVEKSMRGNQLLYSINRKHPIYPDLRSICMKTFGMADVFMQELQPFRDRIEVAFIFGSIACGSDRPDSDVDLMVVGDIDVFELGPTLEKLQKVLGRAVDLNLHTPSEWQALAGDRVIGAIMKEERIMVVGS